MLGAYVNHLMLDFFGNGELFVEPHFHGLLDGGVYEREDFGVVFNECFVVFLVEK